MTQPLSSSFQETIDDGDDSLDISFIGPIVDHRCENKDHLNLLYKIYCLEKDNSYLTQRLCSLSFENSDLKEKLMDFSFEFDRIQNEISLFETRFPCSSSSTLSSSSLWSSSPPSSSTTSVNSGEKIVSFSVKEAMKSLESWIAMEIINDRKQIKINRLYSIPLIEGSVYRDQLDAILTTSQKNWIQILKDLGNKESRAQSKKELLEIIKDEDDDPMDTITKTSLVNKLEYYCIINKVPFGQNAFYY
ncbi:hypothetical protein CYY_003920 [Polysphondylium violaceum]|uniref:Uncharacterized protein n=1 Tax=Polysphondylium violaceum TaxID=133409 RepID=A0A8J4V888_9MYCE|nr:hypothetical protein CYY_003920 [Polysphondylium violaceum]